MKTIFKVLISLIIFVGIDRFCHEQTGTFCLHKITLNRPEDPVWETPALSPAENAQIEKILSQPFTFLGHGNECFAFLSEDQTVVLKCFKLQFLRPAYLKEMLQSSPLEWKSTFINARVQRLARTFDSLKIASDTLKEETGMLYVHLTPTKHLKAPLVLVDKLGIKHSLDPNQIKFVLQKKADLLYPKISTWIKQGEIDKAQDCVASLVQLIAKRAEKQIADRDANIRTNFGCIGQTAIEIDIGSFSTPVETELDPNEEVRYIMTPLWLWAEKEHPELLPYLTQLLTVNQLEI
jgi:hypothetical protein